MYETLRHSCIDMDEHQVGSSSNSHSGVVGYSYVRKAKERVLSKLGRRTRLTLNPKVDYYCIQLDSIKNSRKTIIQLSHTLNALIQKTIQTAKSLDHELVSAWKSQVGSVSCESNAQSDEVLVNCKGRDETELCNQVDIGVGECWNKIEEGMHAFEEGIGVIGDEEWNEKIQHVSKIKEKYKAVRTEYSDSVIEFEQLLSKGGNVEKKRKRVDEKRMNYEFVSDLVCEQIHELLSEFKHEVPNVNIKWNEMMMKYTEDVSELLSGTSELRKKMKGMDGMNEVKLFTESLKSTPRMELDEIQQEIDQTNLRLSTQSMLIHADDVDLETIVQLDEDQLIISNQKTPR
uniref:Uncharacterized protein n=1 Tax=Timspurckia oligopyrenoides TaxID=708627 RepID=A0A7S0ZEC0_9RHOD